MRLDPESYSVVELIQRVGAGSIALPEFQRKFVWRAPAVAELLRTVAREWPMGSFLLLEVGDSVPFAVRRIHGAPQLNSPDRLILDGQQRTTALWRSFGDHSPEVYYVELGAIRDTGDFEDEHLRFEKSTRFHGRLPTLKEMAEARVAKLSILIDETEWQTWLNFLDAEERVEMAKVRKQHLPGFEHYSIPAYRLGKNTSLAAVAKVFETINRTGKRLATFDLLVARLYPQNFNLRTEWDNARQDHEIFRFFGFDDEAGAEKGIEVLKVIALREYAHQRENNLKIKTKGVRESDVLDLDEKVLIGGWADALTAYIRALEFARAKCGAARVGFLPAPSMLLVIADALHPNSSQRAGFEEDLVRWVWAATFRQDYQQGANTAATRDVQAIRAWSKDANALPSAISAFRISAEDLRDGRSRNEILLRGLLALSIVHGAQDWLTGETFDESTEPLEAHHVFPDDFLEDQYDGESDPIANFVVLTKPTNASLRELLPKDVLNKPDIRKTAVDRHLAVNLDDLREDAEVFNNPKLYFTRFLERRAAALVPHMYEAVGVPILPEPKPPAQA